MMERGIALRRLVPLEASRHFFSPGLAARDRRPF